VTVHATAIVEDGAQLAGNVTIGPYCTVGPDVTLAEGVELVSHVAVAGHTHIGADTRIWPFASIGHQPQDLKYRGEDSYLEIGAGCRIREHVTMNPGTEAGGLYTRVGANCLLMAGCHVGHDCQIGIDVVLANNVVLGGHVEIGDAAILGGMSAVHQFVRIGAYAMVGGMSGVDKDVIPYGSVMGNRAELGGLNMVGLKRRGVDRDTLHALRGAYGIIFEGSGALADRAARASEAYPDVAPVRQIADFIAAGGSRNFCTPRDG
jgi:UDP-N-acetylglucosamine acyltransferase